MYLKLSEISQNTDILNMQEESQWDTLTDNKVKEVIFTSSLKKTAELNKINLLLFKKHTKQ